MAPQDDISRYRANLQGEIDSVALYTALAEAETDTRVAEVYRRLEAFKDAAASPALAELNRAIRDG